ncbi:hypothetical protein GCM10022204_43250 [Microlunatus aurantiacus]|uniref:Uncharacterized protein n=1 Tax=Microlunatus aurantiacus TaxID=446786 RepID=A0ABP7EGI3_9ACTN
MAEADWEISALGVALDGGRRVGTGADPTGGSWLHAESPPNKAKASAEARACLQRRAPCAMGTIRSLED